MKIISGGQTGVDRAALAWAIAHRIPHGGWCPRNREAEDGTIPPQFELTETSAEDSLIRTQWNVRDSDGTLIFSRSPDLAGGTKAALDFSKEIGRPVFHVLAATEVDEAASQLREFVKRHRIGVLNVAGPRESEEPGLGAFVGGVLSLGLLPENG